MGAFGQPDTLIGVFEEVSKYNIQLNIVEKMWAVCVDRHEETMDGR